MEISEEVVIVGAGIAGLATALALKRVGVRSLVVERAHELRATGAALTLFPNAWFALEALGVDHKLTSIYAPFKKGYVTNVANGAVQEVSYTGVDGKKNGPRTVHRRKLLEALAEELHPDTIRFSSKLASVETHTTNEGPSMATIRLEDGTVIKAKLLIGCDGVHSVVARWLGLSVPVDSGRSAVRGLAVFPQGHGFDHEVQQFIEQDRRAGIVPLTDKEIYWFIANKSRPVGGEIGGDPQLIQKDVIENLAKGCPPMFLDAVRHTDLDTLTWAPLMFRYPWDLIWGHTCKGNITVAGDAMHPMTPDLGQGGCSSLEDAVVLGRHIGISLHKNGRLVPGEVAGAIERYVKERRWRVAGLITGSYLSGMVQQAGSGWLMKFIRDAIFYKFIYRRIADVVHYDCGKLPSVSLPIESEAQTKID